MDNPRPQKVAVVNEVRERLDGAEAAILTEYRGLTVAELAALRQALRAAGGDYKVYKNTLVKLAIAGGRHEALDAASGGPDGHRLRLGRGQRGGQGPARLRPDQPEPGGQGGPARRGLPVDPGPRAPWPTCPRATCCWPGWPGPSPPRCSSSPASCRRFPATSPTACRPCSTSRVVPRPRPRPRPSDRGPAPRPRLQHRGRRPPRPRPRPRPSRDAPRLTGRSCGRGRRSRGHRETTCRDAEAIGRGRTEPAAEG